MRSDWLTKSSPVLQQELSFHYTDLFCYFCSAESFCGIFICINQKRYIEGLQEMKITLIRHSALKLVEWAFEA